MIGMKSIYGNRHKNRSRIELKAPADDSTANSMLIDESVVEQNQSTSMLSVTPLVSESRVEST